MPELPEVERGRRMAELALAGRTIADAWCAADPIVIEGVSPRILADTLRGKRIAAVHRRGKHIWIELRYPPHLLVHFGMTGGFRTPNGPPLKLRSSGRNPDLAWPPRFARLRLMLDDGSELAFVDSRRFGRIRLRADPLHEPPISELGFDPLLSLPGPRAFTDLVRRRSGNIKALLLDQSFAAGVGNWIADEVLYQARIDPRRTADSLSAAEIHRLRDRLQSVIRIAVEAESDSDRYPKTWLFHHRWGRNAKAQTARGESIRHETIAGRTTAWAPKVQK